MSRMDPGATPQRPTKGKRLSVTFTEESGEVHRVIDIKAVKESFRHFRAIRHGYAGLGLFLVFTTIYVYVLFTQHRASNVGDVNSALDIFLEKQKSDLMSKDAASLYTFMTTKIIPAFLKTKWSEISDGGKHLSGTTTNDYYYVVGGVVLTAKKGKVDRCFHRNVCFHSDLLSEPFYNLSIPGGLSFSVPYDEHFKGYSLNVPSSVDEKTMSSLISAYKGLFGPDTREIWLHVVLYNPSGTKTVSFLEFGAEVSVHNNMKFYSKLQTIPHRWYSPHSKHFQISIELCLVCFTLYAFLVPILKYRFCRPRVRFGASLDHAQLSKIEEWIRAWQHIPAVGGRPRLATPVAIMLLLFSSFAVWLRLGDLYAKMVNFEDSRNDWLFENSMSSTGELPDMLTAALHTMHNRTLPVSASVDDITTAYNQYFVIHAAIMALMVLQMQQYLMFQKHLSMVSDTFSGISDDLIHMGLVLFIVCFFFGVVNSLAFGAYDVSFQSLMQSFFEMLLITFGLYKPASATPFIQSLFKYSPHVLNAAWIMNWLPLAIQIFFKVLVILLLFKLLMGVVMESYKKHKPKHDVPSVRADLVVMANAFYLHIFKRCFRGYVDFLQVALCIAHYEHSLPEDCPAWKTHFLGLDSETSVLQALNDIFSSSAPEQIRNIAKEKGMKHCYHEELKYVLGAYGVNRQKTRVKYAKTLVNKRRKQTDIDFDDVIEDTYEGDVQKQLDEMRNYWEGDYNSIAFLDSESKQIFHDQLKGLFCHFDALRIGTVDHRLIPYLMRELGFVISDRKLADLLYKHDDNNDGDTNLSELLNLIYDDALIGHWKPDYEQRCRLGVMHTSERVIDDDASMTVDWGTHGQQTSNEAHSGDMHTALLGKR